MNAVIQTILNRRSCRSFTGEPVAEEDVRTLLLCAAAAPSGRNRQLGQFTALTDRSKIQKLAAAVGKALGRENYDMYNPAVLIITSNDKTNVFREVDINQLKDCFDNPQVRALLNEFGIPENHGVYGCAAVGRRADVPAPKEIKAVTKIVG